MGTLTFIWCVDVANGTPYLDRSRLITAYNQPPNLNIGRGWLLLFYCNDVRWNGSAVVSCRSRCIVSGHLVPTCDHLVRSDHTRYLFCLDVGSTTNAAASRLHKKTRARFVLHSFLLVRQVSNLSPTPFFVCPRHLIFQRFQTFYGMWGSVAYMSKRKPH